MDGKSSGPKSLTGPIGRRLAGDELRFKPILDFKIIPTTLQDLPPEVVKSLNQDYKFFYCGTKGLAEGPQYFKDNPHMVTASPGPLHESRFITIFNRSIRDYVSTPPEEVTERQRKMVTFIAQVLAPAWFNAIAHPSFVDGPRSLHKLITDLAKFGAENFGEDEEEDHGGEDIEEEDPEDEDSDEEEPAMSKDEREMRKRINNNSYYGHFESVVVAMFYDEDEAV